MSADQPLPRRRRGSPADMVRSLGLVGLVVLGMMLFTLRQEPRHPPVSVDIVATVDAARASTDYPVLAIQNLPKGWYANFADLQAVPGEPGHWTFHIGYVTDDQQFFAVDASDAADAVRTARLNPPTRIEIVAGLKFGVFPDAWIHQDAAVTITLTGSGSHAQWQRFASALESATAS